MNLLNKAIQHHTHYYAKTAPDDYRIPVLSMWGEMGFKVGDEINLIDQNEVYPAEISSLEHGIEVVGNVVIGNFNKYDYERFIEKSDRIYIGDKTFHVLMAAIDYPDIETFYNEKTGEIVFLLKTVHLSICWHTYFIFKPN